MVGEPIAASVALIAVLLGAWCGALGIGAYVTWAFIRGVDASTTEEPIPSAEPTPSLREEVV
jgi:hypothetical protein